MKVSFTASIRPKPAPGLGTMRGTVLYLAPDFDAPLDDFNQSRG